MGTLEKILSQAVLRTGAIKDRVTGKSAEVLGAPAAGKGKTIKLALTGVFEPPWESAQAEITAIQGGTWFPSSVDFNAVMKNSRFRGNGGIIEIGSTEEFVGLILSKPVGSIKEIRLVTHGAPATIGFLGEVVDGNVGFTDEMDLGVIEGLQKTGILVGPGDPDRPPDFTWDDVRARFQKDAVFVIYGCKVGMSESFIQDVADAFGIRVQAFKHNIKFDFPGSALNPGGIDRRKLSVDGRKDILDIPVEIDKTPSVPAPKPPGP